MKRGIPLLGKVIWGCPQGSAIPCCLCPCNPGISSAEFCHGKFPYPSRGLGCQAWPGIWEAPGSPRQPVELGRGPRSRVLRVSNLPASVCDPQPETEDEKRRFEEGKWRYLQMKAKRQGPAEPQP